MSQNKEFIITPRSKFSLGIRELIEYKDLIYIFTWREIKIKYKQTVIGVLWVVLQPVLMMLIINTFLSSVFRKEITQVPYYLYVYSGLIGWNLFSSSANTAVNNILTNANIIKKIYFPRLIIPLSALLSAFVDFLISFMVLLLFLLFENASLLLQFNILYWISSIVVISFCALSIGLYFSALVVKYRDFRYVLPFLIQLLFFLSPVIYRINIEHPLIQHLLVLFNPMVLGMELLRTSLFKEPLHFTFTQVILSILILLSYFLIGLFTFRRTEEYIADKI